MARGLVEALLHARFGLLAARATQRLEMQAVQREASEISARVEDAVDLLLSEAEELGALDLPSPREVLHREESSVMTRPARVVLDLLADSRRKVDVFSQLAATLLQSYRDFKQQCEEMTLKIEALTEDFGGLMQREEPRECRNCRRCLAKLSEFNTEVEQLRAELQETEALLVDSRQAKDQLSKELGTLTHRTRELEKERANSSLAVPEMLELQDELKRAETTINQLEKQLRSTRQESETMRQGWKELQDEVETREKSLKKAHGIIKKLNSENENLVKELEASEELAETMTREAHQQEKSNRDAQIQLQSVEILRKTEVRLREEIQSLKAALETLKEESVIESNQAKDYIDQLRKENDSLQSQIEELETSILELDKEAKQQEETLKLHLERVTDLEQALGQKMGEVEALHRENEAREEEHQAEIAHIKRIAENTIRSLHAEQGDESARSSRSPVRSVSPTLTAGKRASSMKKSIPQATPAKELPQAFTDMQLAGNNEAGIWVPS
jgi:chromosome segregation ATPase